MKALEVSGKELAECLNIDTTTISKWRNNQRKIPYKNGQARQLSEFLISREQERSVSVIFNILKTLKEDINPNSTEQQIEILSRWLTEEKLEPPKDTHDTLQAYSPKNGYNTNVSIFLGEKGIDEGLEAFFERVLKMAPGKIIYIIDYSGINWINGDEFSDRQVRIETCMKFFRAISDYGHKLVIVDCDTDIYRPYRTIFRWMELYLLDGSEVWSYRAMDDSYHYTNFVVENELVLQYVSGSIPTAIPHGMLYTNKETVDFFADNVADTMNKSSRLIVSVPASDVSAIVDIIRRNIKPARRIYMLAPSLTLQIADSALLRKILSDNGVNEEKQEECISASTRLQKVIGSNAYTVVYNLDLLEKFVLNSYFEDNDLSKICNTKIVISKENQRLLIDSIMQSAIYKSNRIIFTSFENLNAIPENLSILVQEDGFVAAWNAKKYKRRLYCTNLDVTSGFYRYLDDLMTTIPKICRERVWRDRQLMRIRNDL
jgi:transcriptional regulator with XRE-family HTH domain